MFWEVGLVSEETRTNYLMIASEKQARVQQVPYHEDVDGKALPAVQSLRVDSPPLGAFCSQCFSIPRPLAAG